MALRNLAGYDPALVEMYNNGEITLSELNGAAAPAPVSMLTASPAAQQQVSYTAPTQVTPTSMMAPAQAAAPVNPFTLDYAQFQQAMQPYAAANNGAYSWASPEGQNGSVGLTLANGKTWTPSGAASGVTFIPKGTVTNPLNPGAKDYDTKLMSWRPKYSTEDTWKISGDMSALLGLTDTNAHKTIEYVLQGNQLVPKNVQDWQYTNNTIGNTLIDAITSPEFALFAAITGASALGGMGGASSAAADVAGMGGGSGLTVGGASGLAEMGGGTGLLSSAAPAAAGMGGGSGLLSSGAALTGGLGTTLAAVDTGLAAQQAAAAAAEQAAAQQAAAQLAQQQAAAAQAAADQAAATAANQAAMQEAAAQQAAAQAAAEQAAAQQAAAQAAAEQAAATSAGSGLTTSGSSAVGMGGGSGLTVGGASGLAEMGGGTGLLSGSTGAGLTAGEIGLGAGLGSALGAIDTGVGVATGTGSLAGVGAGMLPVDYSLGGTGAAAATGGGLLSGIQSGIGSVANALGTTPGGLLGTGANLLGGYLNTEAAQAAAQTQADAQIRAAQIAADAAKFRPVGVSTRFGTSQFGFDPATGYLNSAGYTLSPEMKAQQDALMQTSNGMLTQFQGSQAATAPMADAAARMMSLGNQYLATDPQAQAQKYMADQQALLAAGRNTDMAKLQAQMQAQGRGGFSIGGGDGMYASNPQMQALLNAQRQQDLGLAAQATQGGQQYATFGSGLVGAGGSMLSSMYGTQKDAFAPYQTALGGAQTIEGLGQNALDMGINLGKTSTTANANAGQLLGQGYSNAAGTIGSQAAQAGSTWGNLLQGLGQGTQQYRFDPFTGKAL